MKIKAVDFGDYKNNRSIACLPCLFTFAVSSICNAARADIPPENQSPLRFYATKVASPNPNIEFIQQTADVIAKQIAPRKLEFAFLDIPSLRIRMLTFSLQAQAGIEAIFNTD